MTTCDIQVPPAVRISGLNYRYPDGKDALCGVDLELRSGEVLSSSVRTGRARAPCSCISMDCYPVRGVRIWGIITISPSPAGTAVGRRASGSMASRSITAPRPRSAGKWASSFRILMISSSAGPVLEDVAFGPLNQGASQDEACQIAGNALPGSVLVT